MQQSNTSKYTHVLFDWDGCLAMTLEVWLESYKNALKKRGVVAKNQDIASHFGDWSLGKHFGIEDFQKLNQEAVSQATDLLKSVSLYKGVKEMLDTVRKSHTLALLSSGSRHIVMQGLRHNGIDSYFKFILTGDDVENHKPHPEVILKTLQHFNIHENMAVMVGDSSKDIGAATNAKIDSILVYPPSHSVFYDIDKLKQLKPTFVVNNIQEITTII